MNFNIQAYKTKGKRLALVLVCILLLCSLTACTANVEKRYQTYIKSLIAINYLGATKDYIKASGANKEDADALYDANIELLTDNILSYYSVNIDDAPELRESFKDLARTIYSKVNYKVDKARTREYGGNGIGLSIVKAIMDSHHQSCGIKNHENGVEFWFELERYR